MSTQMPVNNDFWIEIRPLPDTSGPSPGLSRRVAERAAWRAIVRERLGDGISAAYNKNGAPILEGAPDPGYISVSHTRGWVAVIWSMRPCAIDIELKDRKLSAAAAERYSITSIEEWCALEAAYKYEGLTDRRPAPGSVQFISHPELTVAVIW